MKKLYARHGVSHKSLIRYHRLHLSTDSPFLSSPKEIVNPFSAPQKKSDPFRNLTFLLPV